jgi:hypothetical protein
MNNKNSDQCGPPKPLFILKNSHPITKLIFSSKHEDILYMANRNGDLNVFSLSLRRSLFKHNTDNQSILSIAELDANCLLTQTRNGSIFLWNKTNTDWLANCNNL